MTKQEMWDLINKENAIKEENEANIVAAENEISDLQSKIDEAIRKKDSAAAINFSNQLETQRRNLEIYKNIMISYKYGVDIPEEEFMKCFTEEVTVPYLTRANEIKAELSAKREAYIADMKAAYKELMVLTDSDRELREINTAGNLDIDIPAYYPRDAFRELFIEKKQYFFAD